MPSRILFVLKRSLSDVREPKHSDLWTRANQHWQNQREELYGKDVKTMETSIPIIQMDSETTLKLKTD